MDVVDNGFLYFTERIGCKKNLQCKVLNGEWFAHLPRYVVVEPQTPKCQPVSLYHYTFWGHRYIMTPLPRYAVLESKTPNLKPLSLYDQTFWGYRHILKQLHQMLIHKGEHYRGNVLHVSLQSTIPKYSEKVIQPPGIYEL